MGNLWDLKGRFVGMVLILVCVIAIEGVVGIYGFNVVRDRIEHLDRFLIPLMRSLSRIESLHVQLNHQFEKAPRDEQSSDHILVNRRIIHDQTTRIREETIQGIETAEAASRSETLTGNLPELRKITQRLVELRALQVSLDETIAKTPLAGSDGMIRLPVGINRQLVDESEHQYSRADVLLELVEDAMGSSVTALLRLSDKTIFQLITVWILSVVVCVLLAGALAVSILRPIRLAQRAVRHIAEGDLDFHIDPSSHDELGQLLHAMAHMAQALRERQRVESLLRESEKMSSLGRLSIGLAHEVNNPLANAVVNLEVLENELAEQAPAHIERCAVVRRNVEKAMTITRELLNFSRPDLPSMGPVQLQDAIDGVILLLGQRLRSIRVRLDHDEDLPEVMGMSGKLQQVFMNLIQNAIEAMPHGGELVIASRLETEWVRIDIRDSGPGIEPALCSKVMEPFFTTRIERGGVGLGLTVCQNILDQHGGSLVFDTTPAPEGGLRAIVRLPRPGSRTGSSRQHEVK